MVDCPPLTASGKNSADIVMTLDIADAIGHLTRFDKFVLLSSDADFTPVAFERESRSSLRVCCRQLRAR